MWPVWLGHCWERPAATPCIYAGWRNIITDLAHTLTRNATLTSVLRRPQDSIITPVALRDDHSMRILDMLQSVIDGRQCMQETAAYVQQVVASSPVCGMGLLRNRIRANVELSIMAK